MHVTTARTAAAAVDTAGPGQGRALARLQADLAALDRLDPVRRPAFERLEEQLGPELTRKLVFGLSRGAGRPREVRAA